MREESYEQLQNAEVEPNRKSLAQHLLSEALWQLKLDQECLAVVQQMSQETLAQLVYKIAGLSC